MVRLCFFVAQGFMACLPPLLVLLVAHRDPNYGADLSVAFGAVGAAFSIFYFGQRAYISIRGFRVIPARHAISFRLLFSLLAGATSLVFIGPMELGVSVAAFAVAMKLSEGIVDVWVGIRIFASSQYRTALTYSLVAIGRAALIGIPVLWLGGPAAVESKASVAFLILLAAFGYWLVHQDTKLMNLRGSYLFSPIMMGPYAWEMRSFFAATAVCAVLSTMPRLVLPFSNPGAYSSSALSLSVVPIYGLVCQAIWLSNIKGLSENFRRQAPFFLLELIGSLVLAGALWPAWKLLAKVGYQLGGEEAQTAFALTVLVGVLFSAVLCVSNLFKVTRYPRLESICYAVGVGAILVAVFWLGRPINDALLVATGAMAVFSILAFACFPDLYVQHRARPDSLT